MRLATSCAFPVLTVAAACATTPSDVVAEGPRGTCNANGLDEWTGRPASSDIAAAALRRSGASHVRWLRPGQIVTMEYRADRLNIQLDAHNGIIAVRCG